MEEKFEKLVTKSWSNAVEKVSANLSHYRTEVFNALHSKNPEVRSAAVAVLNEANVADAHDDIISLINDSDKSVRCEVGEYLLDYSVISDVDLILESIFKWPDYRFPLSKALCNLTGRETGIIDEDSSIDEVENELKDWKEYIQRLPT